MTTTRDLVPGRTDRALFVGQTGSGKTTLARYLLEQRRYVVVLDPKGRITWPGYQRYTTLRKVEEAGNSGVKRLIYAPVYDELVGDENRLNPIMDAFFGWVYSRQNCTLYVDEVYAVTKGDLFPWHLGACLTRGRELRVETWCATQRPARIPMIVLSEAEHTYAFYLKMPQDRERVWSMTGIDPDVIQALDKREFVYANQYGDVSGPFMLSLGEMAASA